MSHYRSLDAGARKHVDKMVAIILFAKGDDRATYQRELLEIIGNPHKYDPLLVLTCRCVSERIESFAEYISSGDTVGHA